MSTHPNRRIDPHLVFRDIQYSLAAIDEQKQAVRTLISDASTAFENVIHNSALGRVQLRTLKPTSGQKVERDIRLWRNTETGDALGRSLQYSCKAQNSVTVGFIFHQYPNSKIPHVEVVASRDVETQTISKETILAKVSHTIGHGIEI